jgi:hypothetical protein
MGMLHVVGVTRHLEDKTRPWTTTAAVPLRSNIGRHTENNNTIMSKTYCSTYLTHRHTHSLLAPSIPPDTDDANDYASTRPLLQFSSESTHRLLFHVPSRSSSTSRVCRMPTGAGPSLLARRLFFIFTSFAPRSLGPIAHDTDTP